MVFRVSEIYPSIQGEGLNVGTPTLFVRFGGCNLRCPGWPCDTPYAIDPAKYRHEWKRYTIAELHDEIVADCRVENVCFTGGEPFLQPSRELHTLVDELWGQRTLECFSNGTLPYDKDIVDKVTFCMDWKLPSSGEDPFAEKRFDNLQLLKLSSGKHAVKFVIGDEQDFKLATELWEDHLMSGAQNITTYAGAVWDKLSEAEVVEKILELGLPWKLNVQVHNFIWDRSQRGI